VIELSDVEDASRRLSGTIRPTPAIHARGLSDLANREVWVKPEHFQRTGSFKIRGAYNFLALHATTITNNEVVAGSAGNHAQGVALAASLCGMRSTIYMPIGASLPKLEATRAYGAKVILGGDSVDTCIEAAREHAAKQHAIYVPPFDDPDVIAGQGTIGLELLEEAPRGEVVVVPVGGGGLISGIAAAIKASKSSAKVIGVEAQGATAMLAALSAGAPVALETLDTMADGIALHSVSQLTLDHVREYVDEIVTVEEEEISRAVLVLLERQKWVVEPAGAVGLAAVLAGKIPGSERVVVVLSGGNIDPLLLTRLIEHGLSAAGRYIMVRVVLDDKPGSLAQLTATVASLGLNVLSVEHHRSGRLIGMHEVEVYLTVETSDPSHRDGIVPALVARGFRAEAMR
jgi:threonine dehydratase